MDGYALLTVHCTLSTIQYNTIQGLLDVLAWRDLPRIYFVSIYAYGPKAFNNTIFRPTKYCIASKWCERNSIQSLGYVSFLKYYSHLLFCFSTPYYLSAPHLSAHLYDQPLAESLMGYLWIICHYQNMLLIMR